LILDRPNHPGWGNNHRPDDVSRSHHRPENEIDSTARTASLFYADNRIMYRLGTVARDMKMVDWELVIGIPLSVNGKSIYFDR